MPSVTKQLLSIPFARALSQREDPRWLAPGSLIQAVNATHPKSNFISKRPGCATLPLAGISAVPGLAATIAAGKRLAAWHNSLVAVGTGLFTDALWTFDDSLNEPVQKDLVPEVYAQAPRVLAGGSGVVLDMDSCVCNGYMVHVWLYGISSNAGAPAPGCDVYYQVEDAATSQIVIGARSIGQVPGAVGAVAPRIVACGTTAILTFMTGATGTPTANDYTIYATALDCSALPGNWATRRFVVQLPAPPISLTGGATGTGSYPGVYDLDSVIGDPTTYIVAAGIGTTSVTTGIDLIKCSVAATLSGGLSPTFARIDIGDATWSADGATHQTLTGIAIRADATNNEILVAYGWNTNVAGAGGNTRVSSILANYTAMAVIGNAVNLVAHTGVSPNPTTSDFAPQWLAVDRVTRAGQTYYKTYFSPGSCFWDAGQGGGSGQATAYIASYLTKNVAGTMTVQTGSPHITYGARLASRTIQRNSIGYLVGYVPSRYQGTYFLFADDAWSDILTTGTAYPLRVVGTFAPRLASGPSIFFFQRSFVSNQPPLLPFTLPHLVANPTGQGIDPVYTLLSVTQGQLTVTEPNVFSFDFASPKSYQAAMLGENLGIACGTPSVFDGTNCFELGFPYAPFILSVAEGTGGSLVAASTYSYLVTFEKRDSRGQKHRSGRSPVFTHTMGSAKTKLTLTVTTMGYSAREKATAPTPGFGPQGLTTPQVPITIKLWRTVASGTQYLCVDSVDYVNGGGDNTVGNGNTAARYNDATVPTVTLVDGALDANIASNEEVYDDGGDGTQPGSILDNLIPPAFQALIVHQNRFIGINGNEVWPSKAFVTGEGAGFNDLFSFTVDDGPGLLTAAVSMDSSLVLFKRDRIFYMQGFGPTDSDASNDYTPPQRVPSDVGCIDWRSLCVTPQGCFFMSDQGMRLLTRDLQVTPVPNVEDLLSANPVVTSAVIHPTRSRVLWTANTDDTTAPRNGVGLDHDYVLDSWTSSQFPSDAGLIGSVSAAVANVQVGGAPEPTYHWLRADGTICRESPTSYLDGTKYVDMAFYTAWIKSDALEGFARFRRLMVTWENLSPHSLVVYVGYDYGESFIQLGIVTATQMAAMATPLCQELFSLPRQRAEAVRFAVSDSVDGVVAPGTGQGPKIVSLGLEWSAYTNRRLGRLPSAQRT